MSSNQRRRERERQFDAEQIVRRREETRKAELCMWDRIEESDASRMVKDILHRLASGERE